MIFQVEKLKLISCNHSQLKPQVFHLFLLDRPYQKSFLETTVHVSCSECDIFVYYIYRYLVHIKYLMKFEDSGDMVWNRIMTQNNEQIPLISVGFAHYFESLNSKLETY
jgi:hypothetical protein